MRCLSALIALVLMALLAACATPQRIAALDNEPAPTERQIAERRAMLAVKDTMKPTPAERFDIAIIGGSCAPKMSSKFAVSACVNDRPCNGFGLRMADGSVACACFEIRNGCEAGTFCNRRTRKCDKLPDDLYHVP